MLEFQLTAESIRTMPFWLATLLAISTILTLISLLQLGCSRFSLDATWDRVCKGVLALLASLQIFAWQLFFYCDSHDTVALWCFATAILGGVALWRFSVGSTLANLHMARFLPIVIVLISVVELTGFAQATLRFSQLAPSPVLLEPGALVLSSEAIAFTDKGSSIRLSKRDMTPGEFQEFIASMRARVAEMAAKAILRTEPFIESNCHGWVFTGGKHVVHGKDVPTILADNGYFEVSDPMPNDIAIYRDLTGLVAHTGLVRGNFEDAVMVEGKWGIGAIYIHAALDQPYSTAVKYYRTNRGSHLIQVTEKANPKSEIAASASTALRGRALQRM